MHVLPQQNHQAMQASVWPGFIIHSFVERMLVRFDGTTSVPKVFSSLSSTQDTLICFFSENNIEIGYSSLLMENIHTVHQEDCNYKKVLQVLLKSIVSGKLD